jgi:hypothetical protein
MAFSSDEKYLVTVQDGSTTEDGWDLVLLRRRNTAGYPIEASARLSCAAGDLAVSPDGRFAAIGAGGTPCNRSHPGGIS